jgi:hypothetical protein
MPDATPNTSRPFDVSIFSPGEVIGGRGVDIEITDVREGELRARVLAAEPLYSDRAGMKGFIVDQTITLVPGGGGSWIINDSSLPWFVLSVSPSGDKTFEHYR